MQQGWDAQLQISLIPYGARILQSLDSVEGVLASDAWRRRLLRLYWRLQKVLAPGLEYAQQRYTHALLDAVPIGSRWLDLGCGHQLLPHWDRDKDTALVHRTAITVGLDSEPAALRNHPTIATRVAGTASSLPFADATFDIVTANMVVEHLRDPAQQFAEIRRVLRPGGRFIFHTPNRNGHDTVLARIVPEAWRSAVAGLLDGRAGEDRFPTFYRANTSKDIGVVAQSAGLRLLEVKYVASTAVFALVAPLAALELLWIRLTMRWFPTLRSNLLVTLEAPLAPRAP